MTTSSVDHLNDITNAAASVMDCPSYVAWGTQVGKTSGILESRILKSSHWMFNGSDYFEPSNVNPYVTIVSFQIDLDYITGTDRSSESSNGVLCFSVVRSYGGLYILDNVKPINFINNPGNWKRDIIHDIHDLLIGTSENITGQLLVDAVSAICATIRLNTEKENHVKTSPLTMSLLNGPSLHKLVRVKVKSTVSTKTTDRLVSLVHWISQCSKLDTSIIRTHAMYSTDGQDVLVKVQFPHDNLQIEMTMSNEEIKFDTFTADGKTLPINNKNLTRVINVFSDAVSQLTSIYEAFQQ